MGKKKKSSVDKSFAKGLSYNLNKDHLIYNKEDKCFLILNCYTRDIAIHFIDRLIEQRVQCGHLANTLGLLNHDLINDFDEYVKEEDFKTSFKDFKEFVFERRRSKTCFIQTADSYAKKLWEDMNAIHPEESEEVEEKVVEKPHFGPPDLRRRALFCGNVVENTSDQKRIKQTYKDIINQQLVFADCRYITAVRSRLVSEFPYAVNVIDALLQGTLENHAAGKQGILIRPTVIHGLPGLGKSRLAKRVCDLMGIYSRTVSIAGKHDNLIFGLTRGWSSAAPSVMVEVINEAKVINPVLILDEIEKTTEDRRNGNIHETLLPLLEKHEAERWVDPCLSVPCDMSHLGWIFTANEIDSLPAPFRSRVKTVTMEVPKVEHLPVILRRVREDIARSRGLDVRFIRDLDTAERNAIGETFERHGSIRILVEQVKRLLEMREITQH